MKERLRPKTLSLSVKETVRIEQDNICADCGVKVRKLEIHHRVPRCQGGTSERCNLIGLCGEKNNDCHEKWDRLALDEFCYCDLPQVRDLHRL